MQVLQLLAREGIWLDLFAGISGTSENTIELLTTDPTRAAEMLRAADLPVEAAQVVLAWLSDTPACLAQACETLSAAGIHVHAAYVVAVTALRGQQVLIETPDAERADQLLWALHY
jgi:hypothetical protein